MNADEWLAFVNSDHVRRPLAYYVKTGERP